MTAYQENYISGAILYNETIRQSTKDGTPFLKMMTYPTVRSHSFFTHQSPPCDQAIAAIATDPYPYP
ncbi:MAG: class I fructose-bisphosphate aldolase [Coleofasciculus sp. A1-SPW-01]